MPRGYGGRGRNFHPNFLEYMKKIVQHPNYAGMPWAIDSQEKIRWNAPSHRPPGGTWSNLHDERLGWWKTKAKEFNIPLEKGWISKVAKQVHPFKQKPCQTCGRELSLLYIYPTQRTITRINSIPGLKEPFKFEDFRSILAVVPLVKEQSGATGLTQICEILGIPASHVLSSETVVGYLKDVLIRKEPRGVLSPGAMSDAPDRLDGFHTYNICCRGKQDTGRNADNLRTYATDRRAFQFWCEGDWAAADYLMKQRVNGRCAFCGAQAELTADHVGPVSLGFCHRPSFRALCRADNSGRNNRMSLSDVKLLVHDELEGEKVVSWHARAMWDIEKNSVATDDDALNLSKKMRVNQHHYLTILARIKKQGNRDFLESLLHPEFALNRYKLVAFDGTNFSFEQLRASRRAETYARSKMRRVVRIAMQSLDDYAAKNNRNTPLFKDRDLDAAESELLSSLKRGASFENSRKLLQAYMAKVADRLATRGVPRAYELN